MGLKGRYWVGKNNLVIALKDLLKHHHSDFDNDQAEKVCFFFMLYIIV